MDLTVSRLYWRTCIQIRHEFYVTCKERCTSFLSITVCLFCNCFNFLVLVFSNLVYSWRFPVFSFSDGARQPVHDHEVNLLILYISVWCVTG